VHLVFSKVDALIPTLSTRISLQQLYNWKQGDSVIDEKVKSTKLRIQEFGHHRDLSQLHDFSVEVLRRVETENYEYFRDLISFFQARVRTIDTVYCSMTIRDDQGNRLGVKRVLESALP
jgi:hypothetical protein